MKKTLNNKITKMSKYIAFDCETTGLDANVNNLLTATFIVLDTDLNELDRLNISLKSESYTINAKAMEVNKIDIVKHQTNSKDLIDTKAQLINFLKKNKTNFYLTPIGHNIQFDIQFIKKLLGDEYNNYFSYNSVDTIVIANFLKMCGKLPERQPVSLSKLSEYYGIGGFTRDELARKRSAPQRQTTESLNDDQAFHTSEYDTEMTVKLLKKFVELNIFESKKLPLKKRCLE
jgi:DNA polymerase-3 subunit epsilon